MCGIAGFWETDPRRSPDQKSGIIDAMLKSIVHRGPDSQAFDAVNTDGPVLGHTRLSIIGLDNGRQPIESADQPGLWLTVNGEFYDYKRHRARLACEGHSFRTKVDSEILLPYYRRDGLEAVRHLRGEFAVALYDHGRRRLVLIRDRFGIKPIYYHLGTKGVVWGSEIKAVLEHPAVPRQLDPRAAAHQMMQVMVPGMTGFRGIQALLPGHMLIVEEQGGQLQARQERYWDLAFPDQHDDNPDPQPYIEATREQLISAIATRLEADVPVGCYLSGGIDSCSILGLAARIQQSPVKAFTICFDDDEYDESGIAERMAQTVGAEQEKLHLTETELYGNAFVSTALHAERTFYNTLAVAKWHMSKRVNEAGYRVVITGEGSDELFGGYPFFKRDWSDGQERKEGGVFAGAILAEEERQHDAWQQICGFTPGWIQPWMLTLEAARPLFSADLQDAMADYDPIAAVAGALDAKAMAGKHPLDIAQYTWCKTQLEGQILTWGGDRVDMAHSMEARPAFLDHNVAELAARIPPRWRIKDGVEKWVLREAMKEVLPRELYEREKFAFMAPPAHTAQKKQEAVMALARTWLDPERVRLAGLFDPDAVQAFLAQDMAQADLTTSRRHDILLNHLLGLHILHGRLVLQESVAATA